MWKIGVVTSSNSVYRGERENDCFLRLEMLLKSNFDVDVTHHRVSPDNIEMLKENMIELVDRERVDLLITIGGTGLSPEDVTPEATELVIDRHVPGLAEEMRRSAMQNSRKALLTRAAVGTRGNALVINLPGSLPAMEWCFLAIADQISSALAIIQGKNENVNI
ncbi:MULTISPECIES: molybdenum cofactor biosynthesis protein B [Aneurinibacillus]|jgi:molybdopterin adenylyltransferase|uniref:MogA/MoaB family molybdenum cofactor biosynthesis protein n=1 Tax=Aneurinibacillus thermoaerophilus TaxID=143495 RepID=A0A1G8ANZ1_ANETH|nr:MULTISPECIES: MogA/MoaB family molybdenum cofactor biosynthesis protein [Aneurinibacillus]AMA74239.1 molybdenum cofactor biosynthesis protein [Aneurinibacillus sp. XH2]MED0676762.1 MogA/MoaB family molybdenum cofactor biosynthesis protein [Aneurinibacillus thermoaerophilus]MED0680974.1 MogA/MoaB family molybdenum cofactor biosynthesis protein [Aneurinibacillus thermoaerophilus]MED0738611.1 MogA/MoaB family molybdenum cofactor biosynthesis protein [Aneurinibacillus thermoaerophilus]MED075874